MEISIMARFVELNSNNVALRATMVDDWNITDDQGNQVEAIGINYLKNLYGQDTIWKQDVPKTIQLPIGTISITAGNGYTYDSERDAFIPPKPFTSWILNETTFLWESPTPYPTDVGTPENPKSYWWDEETLSWIKNRN
jgi:hypothetical protein